METYLDRIKQLKAERHMTNEQLSECSGIPLGTLSKLLAGMNDSPKLSNVIAICKALECSVEYVITGKPDNTNNYTLSEEERTFMEGFRALDEWGKRLAVTVVEQELARVQAAQMPEPSVKEERAARILRPISPATRTDKEAVIGKRPIKLYELPVSAGVGVYLDEACAETIHIPNSEKTAGADYALRISGNSMEPKYHNDDILLVQAAEGVQPGEMGIFLLDGSGYFKVYGGDKLLSLNPDYAPILLKDYSEVRCTGRVVGRLKRK